MLIVDPDILILLQYFDVAFFLPVSIFARRNIISSFFPDRIFGYQSAALWIGMNNLNTREGYEWVDGSGVGYFNWNQGSPHVTEPQPS